MRLIENETHDKLRGGFYTPEKIASFILKWAFNGNKKCNILEPSCGDGVFLRALKKGGYAYNTITAIEIDSKEAIKAKNLPLENTIVLAQDFHTFCNTVKQKYDIIIGNPPYIRYQYFDKKQQEEAEKIFIRNHIKYSKLMNSWCAFVVGCAEMLHSHGKMGFVLPAEILQVINAKQVRDFLIDNFNKISIISFKKLVFPSIQQDVVLLLCEKGREIAHIEYIEVEDENELLNVDLLKIKNPSKNIYSSSKWTSYFLEQKELDFLQEIKSNNMFIKLGDVAKVEIGITTGANDFFSVTKDIINNFNLKAFSKPLVGRSVQVNGLIFDIEDWINNYNDNIKASLLVFPKIKDMINNKQAIKYISNGEKCGVSKGYKCKIRDEWQIVPSINLSDAFFSRRNNIYARMILNEANAYTTDTMHRIWIKEGINKKALIASYYNSITFSFVELEGRSFGGGALELMPSEVENLYVPYFNENEEIFCELDKLIRNKGNINQLLDYADNIILKQNAGLTHSDIEIAKSIRRKLTNKRLNRKK